MSEQYGWYSAKQSAVGCSLNVYEHEDGREVLVTEVGPTNAWPDAHNLGRVTKWVRNVRRRMSDTGIETCRLCHNPTTRVSMLCSACIKALNWLESEQENGGWVTHKPESQADTARRLLDQFSDIDLTPRLVHRSPWSEEPPEDRVRGAQSRESADE